MQACASSARDAAVTLLLLASAAIASSKGSLALSFSLTALPVLLQALLLVVHSGGRARRRGADCGGMGGLLGPRATGRPVDPSKKAWRAGGFSGTAIGEGWGGPEDMCEVRLKV